MSDESKPETWSVFPVLIVENLAASIPYWRDRLGFAHLGSLGEPPRMAFVGRGGVEFMLQDSAGKPTPGPNRGYKPGTWDAHVWVQDADALHAELVGRGAEVLSAPCDTGYQTREFEVADLDGHVIAFAHDLSRR